MQASCGVDAHAHVFHRGLKLAEGRRYNPTMDAPLPAYLAMLDKLGMRYGVLVQPSFLGFDNSFLLDCIARAEGRLRGVAVVPEDITVPDLVALSAAGVVGIRFNLIGNTLPDFRSPRWRAHLQRVAKAGLHIEVQCRGDEVDRVLPALLEYIPHVVLDHFGLPANVNPTDGVVRQILSFGATRRVFVKVSAPYRFLRTGHALQPLLLAYLDAFGAERLMWGSDWPHTQFESLGNPNWALDELQEVIGTNNFKYNTIISGTAQNLYAFG